MARLEIQSEVTGNVWKIEVQSGARVDAGDVLMILESMKMEIPVEAPAAGTVAELRVAEEDAVEEDQVIAISRPSMSWEEEVREIHRRRRLAKQQGGKEGIAKQHARGRLTIRRAHRRRPGPRHVRGAGPGHGHPRLRRQRQAARIRAGQLRGGFRSDRGSPGDRRRRGLHAEGRLAQCGRLAQERLRRASRRAIPGAAGYAHWKAAAAASRAAADAGAVLSANPCTQRTDSG